MIDNNLPLSEQYRVAAEQWVDADAAANLLEETKSAVLNQMMLDKGEKTVNRAEMLVKASPEWRDHVTKIVEARKKASLLKIKVEYIRMKFHEWQSYEATRRAEMKL
jgi:hypothetical protein